MLEGMFEVSRYKHKKKRKVSTEEKALNKLRMNGPKEAVRYIVARMVATRNTNMPLNGVPAYIIESARVLALKEIREIERRKKEKERAEEEKLREYQEEQEKHKKAILKGFLETENKVRFYAGLSSEDAKILSGIATKEFIKQVREFRKNSITAKKATEILGCSYYELNKWDKQGLVPHAFTKKIYIDEANKYIESRFWNLEDLTAVNVEKLRKRIDK